LLENNKKRSLVFLWGWKWREKSFDLLARLMLDADQKRWGHKIEFV